MGNVQAKINKIIHKNEKKDSVPSEAKTKCGSFLVFLDLQRDNKDDAANVTLAKDLFGY